MAAPDTTPSSELEDTGTHHPTPEAHHQIMARTPSVSPTPSDMDVFAGLISPTPSLPSSPTPQRTPINPAFVNRALTEDVTMDEPPANPGNRLSTENPTTLHRQRPLSISHSEGNIQIIRAPPPNFSTAPSPDDLLARLEAAAERDATPSPINRRRPIDKYTLGPMPEIHDRCPTAVLKHVDIRLAREWLNFAEGKVLAIPFGNEAKDPTLLNYVKNRIFTAASEITQSLDVCVSAPRPSPRAEEEGESPLAFCIYNLTDAQCTTLLERKVWSSTAITFRVTKLNPSCPDFLFTLEGFSTSADKILQMVQTAWQGDDVSAITDTLSSSFPENTRDRVKTSIQAFLRSARIKFLDFKEKDDVRNPLHHVLADGSLIQNDELWLYLRNFLASRTYETLVLGQGRIRERPIDCGFCHSVDHPMGLCPFPSVPGWNGPGSNHTNPMNSNTNLNRRGRGARAWGPNTRGRLGGRR